MNKKQFRLSGLILMVAVVSIAAAAILFGNAALMLSVIIAGTSSMFLLKHRTKEVIEDERNYRISEKASKTVFQIFTFSAAIIGSTLVALSTNIYVEYRSIGLTLTFSSAAILMLYTVCYRYYSKKFGD